MALEEKTDKPSVIQEEEPGVSSQETTDKLNPENVEKLLITDNEGKTEVKSGSPENEQPSLPQDNKPNKAANKLAAGKVKKPLMKMDESFKAALIARGLLMPDDDEAGENGVKASSPEHLKQEAEKIKSSNMSSQESNAQKEDKSTKALTSKAPMKIDDSFKAALIARGLLMPDDEGEVKETEADCSPEKDKPTIDKLDKDSSQNTYKPSSDVLKWEEMFETKSLKELEKIAQLPGSLMRARREAAANIIARRKGPSTEKTPVVKIDESFKEAFIARGLLMPEDEDEVDEISQEFQDLPMQELKKLCSKSGAHLRNERIKASIELLKRGLTPEALTKILPLKDLDFKDISSWASESAIWYIVSAESSLCNRPLITSLSTPYLLKLMSFDSAQGFKAKKKYARFELINRGVSSVKFGLNPNVKRTVNEEMSQLSNDSLKEICCQPGTDDKKRRRQARDELRRRGIPESEIPRPLLNWELYEKYCEENASKSSRYNEEHKYRTVDQDETFEANTFDYYHTISNRKRSVSPPFKSRFILNRQSEEEKRGEDSRRPPDIEEKREGSIPFTSEGKISQPSTSTSSAYRREQRPSVFHASDKSSSVTSILQTVFDKGEIQRRPEISSTSSPVVQKSSYSDFTASVEAGGPGLKTGEEKQPYKIIPASMNEKQNISSTSCGRVSHFSSAPVVYQKEGPKITSSSEDEMGGRRQLNKIDNEEPPFKILRNVASTAVPVVYPKVVSSSSDQGRVVKGILRSRFAEKSEHFGRQPQDTHTIHEEPPAKSSSLTAIAQSYSDLQPKPREFKVSVTRETSAKPFTPHDLSQFETILYNIVQVTDGPQPAIENTTCNGNELLIICGNDFSVKYLLRVVPRLMLDGIRLLASRVDSTVRSVPLFQLVFPTSDKSATDLLRIIQAFNSGLDTTNWVVVNSKNNNGVLVVTVRIPEKDLKFLQQCDWKLNFGLQCINVTKAV